MSTRADRERIVREHMESENRHEFVAVFEFGDERLVCERVYFDVATIMRQLGLLG